MKTKELIIIGALLSVTGTGWASGFGISGKSASNLGSAFSGTAVLAEDASVVYTNPAAMQYLDGQQFSILMHSIGSDLQFEDDGSNTTGGASTSVRDPHYVPNLYYVNNLGNDLSFGFGIYAPFGLGLDYDDDWKGRYITTGSDMKIINFSPALSYRASDKLNLGVGVDFQYIDATLENAVDFGTLCALYSAGPCSDGSQKLTGTSWASGYSLGLTYDLDSATRLGMSFHSTTHHDISGQSDFGGTPAAFAAMGMFTDTDASLSLDLPETLDVGISRVITPRLQLMADATWTRWSRYDELVVKFDNNTPTSTTKQDWHDTWRLSVGGNYQLNQRWLLRGGISHDPTPIPDAQHRSPRVPGTTRNWVSLGGNAQLDKAMSVDFALSYTLPVTTQIDNTDPLGHNLKGEYKSEILYLTAQLNWKF